MTYVTLVHGDGTDCEHRGPPAWTSPDGPALCPAGTVITHVRAGAQSMELAAAIAAVNEAAAAVAAAVTPLVQGMARWVLVSRPGSRIRAVLAAGDVLHDPHAPAPYARIEGEHPGAALPEGRSDPCGDGPITATEGDTRTCP